MNNIYGKAFNYEKNIKPAPNPHYMLERYCGNLSIQEYRSLHFLHGSRCMFYEADLKSSLNVHAQGALQVFACCYDSCRFR